MSYLSPRPCTEKEVYLPYGEGTYTLSLPDGCHAEWVAPRPMPPCTAVATRLQELLQALPLHVQKQAAQVQRVGIVINDLTRPPVQWSIAPLLIDWLQKLNSRAAISIYIANGLHPPLSTNEFSQLLPAALLQQVAIVNHNAEMQSALSFCGATAYGTPVYINSRFLTEDLRIVIGIIEPHQFMGYSGGAKGAAIGLAGRQTITANHALLHQSKAHMGALINNPARMDVEEIGEEIGLHFCVDSLLNNEGEISAMFVGASREVLQAAAATLNTYRLYNVGQQYDLVVASAGGWPKDINLYQAQKALAHAVPFAATQAAIVLLAQCREGIGDLQFERWFSDCASPQEALVRFRNKPFSIGPHKGYLWARDMVEHPVYLYSQLPKSKVMALHLHATPSLTSLLQKLVGGRAAHIALLPQATMIMTPPPSSDEDYPNFTDATN